MEVTKTQPKYFWVLRYSSIAFLLLVLMQSFGVISATPQFKSLLANFGGSFPSVTGFSLKYYWVGCIGTAVISIACTAYIWLKPQAAEVRLKLAYGFALLALIGAFAWSGFIFTALYQPIFLLGTPI